MSELWKPRCPGYPRASWKVRGGVVGQEQDQGVEEDYDIPLRPGSSICEPVTRQFGLTSVTQDYIFQRHAPAVMSVRRSAAHSPQRRGQEFSPDRAVVVNLMEIRAQVVTFEVSENIPHNEVAEVGSLDRRKSPDILDLGEEGSCRRKHIVDRVAPVRIEPRLHIGDPAVSIDRQVLDVARGASYISELFQTIVGVAKSGRRVAGSLRDRFWRSLTQPRLEVMEQVKLHEINKAGGNLIHDPVVVRVITLVVHWRSLDCVEVSVERHPGWRDETRAGGGGAQFQVDRLKPHLGVERADEELPHGDGIAV